MNRRLFLMTTAAGALSSQIVHAADAKAAGGALDAKKLEKLQVETANCVEAAKHCLDHCDKLIAAGDNSMKDCRASVINLIAVSEALHKVAKENTAPVKLIKNLAKTCSEYCKHCEAQCKPHEKHDVCKKCMASCEACRKACDAIA